MNYKRIYDNLMNKVKERGKVDGEYMELITLSYIRGSTHYFFTKDITNYFRENAKRFNFKTLSIQFINSKFGSVESLVDAVGEYHSVNCKCLGKGYHLIRRYNLQRYGHELRNEIYDFFE